MNTKSGIGHTSRAAATQRGRKRLSAALVVIIASASFALSGKAASITVTGNSQSSISSAIAAACNGTTAGIVTLPNGTYTVDSGFHFPSSCTLQAQNAGQAVLNVTNNDYGIYLDGNNVTISGIIFNGGGIYTTNGDQTNPQSNVTITNNVFQKISSGKLGLQGNGVWVNFRITYNRFSYISSIPWTSINSTGGQIVENGAIAGGGIWNPNGLDGTTIDYNSFDHIVGDAIQIAFNSSSSDQASVYRKASNNDISYNTFHDLHRMAVEAQGTTGNCPGTCLYTNFITNTTVKGNFDYHQIYPYWNSMGYSLVIDGAKGSQFLNNTAIADATNSCGGSSDAMENSGDGQLSQGNVLSSSTGACGGGKGWGAYFATGSIFPGYTIVHQNNLLCGGSTSGQYFEYEGWNQQAGHAGNGSSIEQYNAMLASCPSAGDPSVSTLAMTSTSANNQSFSNGGSGSWSVAVVDGISVRYVQFFLDGSSSPVATQELQDLNKNFANDQKWLYHATIDLSTLNKGSHTISAIATDVSGATKTVTQNFQVGPSTPTIPAVSLSPTNLNFPSQQTGISSTSQTVTLTNTGTGALIISNIQVSGANASDFASAFSCGQTLSPGASCSLQIVFNPAAAGSRSASITVSDNAVGGIQTVALSGSATAPVPQPAPTIPTPITPTTPSPTNGALPTNLPSGMVLWLANNTGIVTNGNGLSAWIDQSGNGNNAVQANSTNQPTVVPANGGQNALHFDGASSFMTIPSLPISGSTGMTVFLVSSSSSNPSAMYGTYALLSWPETAYWGTTYFSSFQSSAHFRFGTTQVGNEPTYMMPFTRTNSFGLSEWEHSGTTDSMWFNAQSVATISGVLSQINGVGNTATLGKGMNETYYSGDVSEAIIYTRALSATEREAVEQYLMKKYHL